MSLVSIAFHQIAIMFILILIGVICYKVKLIDKEANKRLADLVLMLVNPFVIFVSYQREFDAGLLKGLLISLLLAMATHIFGIIVTLLMLPKKHHEADISIERFAAIYSNCGFMGIPLVNGFFGGEGVFYLTAYITIFNLMVWTHGLITISGRTDKKSILKALVSPSVLSTFIGFICFICKLMLPDMVYQAFSYISATNTPLAMIVAGATIAQTNIIKLVSKIRIYYISFLKLLFIPIAMLLLFGLFDIPRTVMLTSVLAAACPTAVTLNLFSIRYGKNYLYSSEIFTVTTLLCAVTIPLVMIVANLLA